jgi:hypothetical protein
MQRFSHLDIPKCHLIHTYMQLYQRFHLSRVGYYFYLHAAIIKFTLLATCHVITSKSLVTIIVFKLS